MADRKKCPWWRGHDWRADGRVDVLTIRRTCTRCGLVEVFDAVLDEAYYIEPKEDHR